MAKIIVIFFLGVLALTIPAYVWNKIKGRN